MKLHLGAGKNPKEGYVNLDMSSLPGIDVVANLEACDTVPLPFEDNSVDEFLAEHLIEHIRNPLPLMQELHRIAKPDAKIYFACPHGGSDDAWENPTHVRAMFPHSFGYFSQPYFWREDYGYKGDWRVDKVQLILLPEFADSCNGNLDVMTFKVTTMRNTVLEMRAVLSAVKPIREPLRENQEPMAVEYVRGRHG